MGGERLLTSRLVDCLPLRAKRKSEGFTLKKD